VKKAVTLFKKCDSGGAKAGNFQNHLSGSKDPDAPSVPCGQKRIKQLTTKNELTIQLNYEEEEK
jgi:hypothetical protein